MHERSSIGTPALPNPSGQFEQDLIRALVPYFNSLSNRLAGDSDDSVSSFASQTDLQDQLSELVDSLGGTRADLDKIKDLFDALNTTVTGLAGKSTDRQDANVRDLERRIIRLEEIVKME